MRLRTADGIRSRSRLLSKVLTVIPTYYILFAAMAGFTQAVVIESTVTCGFWALAVVGFKKKNLWLVAAGLAGHGVFDFFLPRIHSNLGVPAFWPGFCGSIDVFLGVFLAVLLMKVLQGTPVSNEAACRSHRETNPPMKYGAVP